MLRVTGGAWRGRKIETLEGEATRPSMDQHRQRLMNILGHDMTGVVVLDLFAGSGAFAYECLSRGAARAVLVEQSRDALNVIRKNTAKLVSDAATCEIVAGDCYQPPAAGVTGPFDIIFIAPPYPHFVAERAGLDKLILALPSLLLADGVAIIQSDAAQFALPEGAAGLRVANVRKMGRTEFTFIERSAGAADAGDIGDAGSIRNPGTGPDS